MLKACLTPFCCSQELNPSTQPFDVNTLIVSMVFFTG